MSRNLFIRRFVFSTAAVLVASSAGRAEAGTRHYDLSLLLNQPHPFATAQAPAPLLPATAPQRPPPPVPAVKTYEQRVDEWVAGRGSTLGRLVGAAPPRGSKPPAAVWAEPEPPRRIRPDDHRLQIGLGVFDVTDNETSAEFRVEWQGKKLLWIVRPLAGMMGTSDGAYYTYAGIAWDIFFGTRWVLTTSFAPGVYIQNDGKKLGSYVEFRSMGEIAYKFDSGSRLGLAIYHLSNAGITQYNPGVEVLSLSYTIPFEKLF